MQIDHSAYLDKLIIDAFDCRRSAQLARDPDERAKLLHKAGKLLQMAELFRAENSAD